MTYLIVDLKPVGKFPDPDAARRAAVAMNAEARVWFLDSVEDAATQLSEPQIRTVLSTLRPDDPDLKKRIRSKQLAGARLMKELEAHDFGAQRKARIPEDAFITIIGDISKRRGGFRDNLEAIGNGIALKDLIAKRAHVYPANEIRFDIRRAEDLGLVKVAR